MVVSTEKPLSMYPLTGGTSQISIVQIPKSPPNVDRLHYFWNHHKILFGICENRIKPQIWYRKPKDDSKQAVGIWGSKHWLLILLPFAKQIIAHFLVKPNWGLKCTLLRNNSRQISCVVLLALLFSSSLRITFCFSGFLGECVEGPLKYHKQFQRET